jgi:hypothetical protein
VEWLTFRSLTFVSDSEVDMTFDADDGGEVTYRFTVAPVYLDKADRVINVVNGDKEYSWLYSRIPGSETPAWPMQLVHRALAARAEPLPAGQELERRRHENAEARRREWARNHPPVVDSENEPNG